MPASAGGGFGNDILDRLPPDEAERLRPHLETVSFAVRAVLSQSDEVIVDVYFPTTALVSLSLVTRDGAATEVATIGREGMAGTPVFLGAESMPMQTICQVSGDAIRLDANVLRAEAERGGALREGLALFTQALFTQVAQASVCNRLHPLEERLARWLLTTRDRVTDDEFALTQEFLAEMLGVRRATVTVAAGALQRAGFIAYTRGRIRINDRAGLESSACECYAVIRQEYARLLS